MRYLVLLIFLASVLGLILSDDKLIYALMLAISITMMFFFPIKYPNREQVSQQSQKPISFWQSPLPYLALITVLMIYFFNG